MVALTPPICKKRGKELYKSPDFSARAPNANLDKLVEETVVTEQRPDNARQAALDYHEFPKPGKLEIRATKRTCFKSDSTGGAPMPMLSLSAKGTGHAVGVPRQIQRKETFEGVPPTACWGMENCKELFGLGSDSVKESLTAAFEAGTDDNKRKFLFGGSGIVSRTLDH